MYGPTDMTGVPPKQTQHFQLVTTDHKMVYMVSSLRAQLLQK